MEQKPSSGPKKEIGRNETQMGWREKPAIQIVKRAFFVIDVAAVAERLHSAQGACQRASLANRLTPCIVLVVYHSSAVAVKNGNNVTQKVEKATRQIPGG